MASLEGKSILTAFFIPASNVLMAAELATFALPARRMRPLLRLGSSLPSLAEHIRRNISPPPSSEQKNHKGNMPGEFISLRFILEERDLDENRSANFLALPSRQVHTWSGRARNVISTGPQAAAKYHSRGWIPWPLLRLQN